jgi:phosphoribosylformylglycinamidine synthase subunit PurSL
MSTAELRNSAVYEVRVFNQDWVDDPRAAEVARQAELMYGEHLGGLATADVYYVELDGDPAEAGPEHEAAIMTLAEQLLADPVTQRFEIGPRSNWEDSGIIEVGRKPGVQDPDARAIQHAASYLEIDTAAVATAVQYQFRADTPDHARENVLKIVVNDTVDEVHTHSRDTLMVEGEAGPARRLAEIHDMSLFQLRELSSQNSWHMNDSDLLTMQRHSIERVEAGGKPLSDVEAEFIAGRRSDHCAHLTFGAGIIDGHTNQHKQSLFGRIKEAANEVIEKTGNILSAFHDNAGVMKFYNGYAIAIKKETHNSPSAVEPEGGAGTGTSGVIRDILGCGKVFKPILLDAMFAHARAAFDKMRLPRGVKPPDYLRHGVIAGSRDYGNQMGIPTAEVHLITDDSFVAKPTVMVGAYGIAKEEYAKQGEPKVGDLVITIGGRTGRDGLHGATFSSGSMTAETSTKNASSVQIGDPIMEKMVTDALLELHDAGLIRAVTDCGAAGYGSAVGEIGSKTGVTINLDAIPTKYPGLEGWEKLMSESQERMVLAVENDPEKLELMAAILAKHGVEWANIGVFDGSRHFKAMHQGETVADLPYGFLEDGFRIERRVALWEQPEFAERRPEITDMTHAIEQVLGHDNVRYTGDVIGQYDTTVQGNTVLPLMGGLHHDMPNDAVVITPLRDEYPDEHFAMIRSHAAHPKIMYVDPRKGAMATYAEALSKFVAVGGCPVNTKIRGSTGTSVAAMNNYSWPTPDTEQKMGSLDQAVDGVNEAQAKTGVPVISGKDSVSSTFKDPDGHVIDINPVLDITIVGAIPDARKTVTADLKRTGSTLVMVGVPDYDGMAGSVLHEVTDGESGRVPQVDMDRLPATLMGVYNAIQTGEVLATKAIGRGGLAAAVTQMSFGGDKGVSLAFDDKKASLADRLFNETAGCFVVEVESPEVAAELFGNVPHTVIGQTTDDNRLRVHHGDRQAVNVATSRLKAAWKSEAELLAA